MYIATLAALQKKKASEEANKCLAQDSTGCEPEIDDETWFRQLIAPNPDRFRGSKRRGQRPTLYGDPEGFDDDGVKKHWDVLWGAIADNAIDAHLTAGKTQQAAPVEGFDAYRIRAVSLGYEETDAVAFFSLDLDGKYNPRKVMRALVTAFGKRSVLPHSGSGTEGRFRVLGLLRHPMEVRRLKALLGAICKLYGFPPLGGALEIYPCRNHTRMPFGAGGCQMFDPETLRSLGLPNQAACLRAFRNLVPIDLELAAKELGIDPSGIDTGIPIFRRDEFDPFARRVRPRPTPRPIRRRITQGIQGPGDRQALTWIFIYDCLLSGRSMQRAIELFSEYVEAGKMDKSRDIARYGRAWFLKQIPRTVRRIYACARPVGTPDPIALSDRELALIDDLVELVPRTRHTSPRRARRMLRMVLPHFKGCLAAGLPLLRWHSDLWRAAGGTHYKYMREQLGIFMQRTGYKSLALVRSRAHLGAKDSEAYAISWSTSFDFDRDLPSPSYDIARSIGWQSQVDEESASNTSTTRTPRLYVYRKPIHGKNKGSDLSFPSSDSPDSSTPTAHATQADPAALPDARLPRRSRPVKAPKVPRSTPNPSERPKVPEWRRLHNWSPKATADQSLDEFLDACHAAKDLVREYNRELSRAKRKQAAEGRRSALGRFVTDRFHELRAMFGLDPWK